MPPIAQLDNPLRGTSHYIKRVVAVVNARLWIKAKQSAADDWRSFRSMAGVGGYYRIAPADRIICLPDPYGAKRVTNGAVQAAAPLEEEAAVPINRQAQAKPDGVGLAVLAQALIDFADDLAVRGGRRIGGGCACASVIVVFGIGACLSSAQEYTRAAPSGWASATTANKLIMSKTRERTRR